MSNRFAPVVIAALVGSFAAAAKAQEAPEAPPKPAVLRLYNVADLLPPEMKSTPSDAGTPNKPVNLSSPPLSISNAERSEWINNTIRETFGVGDWKEDGGQIGSLRFTPDGNLMMVIQTEATHAQINDFLEQLRRVQAHTSVLRVRIDWTVADSSDSAAAAATQPAAVARVQALRATTRPTDTNDEDAVFAHGRPYAAVETTCFTGRVAEFNAGRQRPVIADLTPVVAQNSVAYDPTVEALRSGVTVRFTTRLLPGNDAAVIELNSHVTEVEPRAALPEMGSLSAGADPAVMACAIDASSLVTQDVSAVTRLPVGRRVRVASMTLPPAPGETAPRPLAVWVRVDVVP